MYHQSVKLFKEVIYLILSKIATLDIKQNIFGIYLFFNKSWPYI